MQHWLVQKPQRAACTFDDHVAAASENRQGACAPRLPGPEVGVRGTPARQRRMPRSCPMTRTVQARRAPWYSAWSGYGRVGVDFPHSAREDVTPIIRPREHLTVSCGGDDNTPVAQSQGNPSLLTSTEEVYKETYRAHVGVRPITFCSSRLSTTPANSLLALSFPLRLSHTPLEVVSRHHPQGPHQHARAPLIWPPPG